MNTLPPSSAARPLTYGAVAKSLHWLVAFGVIVTFGLGWFMTDIPGITPTKLKYFNWHKWLGVTLFALSLLRILWRAFNPPPPYATTRLSRFQHLAAQGMHLALYAATIGVPLSGYLYTLAAGYPVVYLGLFQLPVLFAKNSELAAQLQTVHAVFAYGMAAAVVAHAAAALVHHFRDRDDVLLRMLPRFLSSSSSRTSTKA